MTIARELARFLEIDPEEAARRVKASRPNINTAPYWDQIWTQEGQNTWRQYPLAFQKVASYVDKEDTVLDVGCGVGVLLDKLKPVCKEVTGLDISPRAIETLKARGIEGKVGELPQIDYPDNSFDVVIATETLEHMDQPDVLIEEMVRVARKRLVLTVPNQVLSPEEIAEHQQLFNKSSLNNLLTRFFTQVTIEDFDDAFKTPSQNICLPTLLAACDMKDTRDREPQESSVITVTEPDILSELAAREESPQYRKATAPLKQYHNRKILEIGAGIGTLCIQLAYAGNDVTYYDINPTLQEFARQRFEDRGLPITIAGNINELRDFDIVVANDLFEHIHKDALPGLLKQIAGCLKNGGFLYHRSNFGQQDIFPMHFDHSEYFTKMARDVELIERANKDLVKGGPSQGVQIGVPMLGAMTDEWFQSFLSLNKPTNTRLTKVSSRPADTARNEIVAKLERDWLFLMDGDQTFHPETLNKLLSWDLPVVSGLYFKSPGNPVPHCYKYCYQGAEAREPHYYSPLIDPIADFLLRHTESLKGPEAVILPSKREDLIECDGVGGGCILVHRKVLDLIEPPYFEYSEGTMAGEDFYFCRKIQQAGFKIYVDPGVICGHRMKGFIGAGHFLNFVSTRGKQLGTYPYPWNEPGEKQQEV